MNLQDYINKEKEELIQKLGDLCHESYLGCEPINPENNKYSYGYKSEVIWLLDTPRGKELIAQSLTRIAKATAEAEEKKYNEIFSWLLGENGDFPVSVPGNRYNFRTELRQRIADLQKKREGFLDE